MRICRSGYEVEVQSGCMFFPWLKIPIRSTAEKTLGQTRFQDPLSVWRGRILHSTYTMCIYLFLSSTLYHSIVPSTSVLEFLVWGCESYRLDHFSRVPSGLKSRFYPTAKAAGGVSDILHKCFPGYNIDMGGSL